MNRMIRELRVWVLLTVAVACVMFLARPMAVASADAMACGAGDTNSVAVQFNIPAASLIFEYFPNMGISPELAADDQPAEVVVFDNPYETFTRGAPGTARRLNALQDVICVVQADGTVNVYADFSRVGFTTTP